MAGTVCVLTGISLMRTVLFGLSTITISLIVCVLLGELLVFRFVLPGSDIPANIFDSNVVKYEPNQTGIYRIRNEIAAPFRINSNGWNSHHDRYPLQRTDGKMRIAIIGDSYVEALQVPYDQSLSEVMERNLGDGVEVFRFGISGAPLSQYWHMLREEVVQFRPGLVVLVLTHNDFDESFSYQPGRYTSSFLKVQIENGNVSAEYPPKPYRTSLLDYIRLSATVRYFYYR